ncbi:MAG: RT0821/Lpp0805 family surface protein [Alphaproteobacteria bacterium]
MRTSIKTTLVAVIGISIASLTAAPADAGRNDHKRQARAVHSTTKHVTKKVTYRRDSRRSTWRHNRRVHRAFRRHAPPRWAPAYGYRYKKYKHRKAVVYRSRPRYVRPIIKRRVHVVRHNDIYYGSNNSLAGGLIGAALGGLVGSQFGKGDGRTAAIIGGAVIGGLIGGDIGNSMDRSDYVQTSYVLETAPSGRAVTWQNPDSGLEYSVTPTRTYQRADGQYCREFTTWGWIGGYEEQLHGTACRMADGSWRNVS